MPGATGKAQKATFMPTAPARACRPTPARRPPSFPPLQGGGGGAHSAATGGWGGLSGDNLSGENFVRGKFRHTSNSGAGPSDAGNFNTPNCEQMRPVLHSHEAHERSR